MTAPGEVLASPGRLALNWFIRRVGRRPCADDRPLPVRRVTELGCGLYGGPASPAEE